MRLSLRKILILCISVTFSVVPVSALTQETVLSFGDVLILYFTELFPDNNKSINEVVVKYSGLSDRATLRNALQKGIYYGMLPNLSTELHPDAPMTDRAFAKMLQKDFWLVITADLSELTFTDYENLMKNVRNGFAYKVIKSLATPTKIENPVPTTETDVNFSSASRLPTADNFYVLESVYSLLQDNYLRSSTLDQKELIYAATEGMVNELGDQYTKFFRPDASADFHNSLDGTVVGIGVVIEVDPQGYLSVTDVIRAGPADKAGILPKDRIIQINGINVSTKDGIADDIGNLRGKEGTSVDVTVQTGKNIHTLTIVRQKVQIKLVETDTVQNAFRIKYSEVWLGTDALFRAALQKFLKTGKKRLILDLRNNPGGSLFETKNVLNYFIEKGSPTLILKYPRAENITYATEAALTDWSKYEIVILINHDTASAAEVIASTLKEYFPKNVVLIGETSYGKGTVQELIPFDDDSLLKYTVAEWLTPKNKTSVNLTGIKPDKVVTFDAKIWKSKKIDSQLLAAERYVFGK